MLRVEPQRSYGRFGSREERYGSIRVRLAMFASRAKSTIADRTARHFFRRLGLLKTADKNSSFVRRPRAAHLRWCQRCGKGGRHWIQLGKAWREAAEWSRRMCGRLPVTCQIESHRRWATP